MKKKTKVRDEWIPQTWRYNGSGYQKSKKKEIPPQQKIQRKVFLNLVRTKSPLSFPKSSH